MARWLVTGGAGFIGSHLVEALVKKGESVRVLDNFSTGKPANLEFFKKKIELHKGDIREARDVRRAVKNIDYVLHQAALRSVVRSLENPVLTNEVNVGGTLTILWESLRANVKRVVYASSSSVYGNTHHFPQAPTQIPQPVSPYATSKHAAENYVRVFCETYKLSTVSLRYFNVFGPRMDPKSKYALVIPIFMDAVKHNKPIPIEGDGRQSRDFCYIDNVISANILAATRAGVSGQAFNVACGKSYSLLDYVRILEQIVHRKLPVKYLPARSGDMHKTWADIASTKKILGYKPLVQFPDGVLRTWEQFK